MQGDGEELVELAEQAGRNATVTPDADRPLRCPTCQQPLAHGEVPGTAVGIDSCAAHGTWFDRNALHLVALRFAKLPPPLQARPEDYQLPAPAPETFGDWVHQEAFGASKKTANDAIPYVAGVRAGGTFWTDEVLGILLAVALLGTATSCAMHVASLLGHTVTNGPLLLVTTLAIFPLFGLGVWANYQMGNAVKTADGIAMGTRHLLRGLSWIEWSVFVAAELYAAAAVTYLWPAGTDRIVVPGSDLTVANARAVWACCVAFYVAAVAIVLTALRVARRPPVVSEP
jgi:hypothetical protein